MSSIKLSADSKKAVVGKIQRYFKRELDQEIGSFDAEFLVDFFSNEIGGYFYNQGLYDAQVIISSRLEDIADSIYELEKQVDS